ncbi:MAG: HAD-IIA family hydrolase [Thermoplasmatota archaeon]
MRGVILDIDGVLRRGREVVPGSVEAVEAMMGKGLAICYLTNNSTRSRETMLSTLTSMGFPEALLVSSAQAAAEYIGEIAGPSRCLVVGEIGLFQELSLAEHRVVEAGKGDWRADFVVAGLDRDLTYAKVRDSLWAIRDGARFVATNRDPTLPQEGGRVVPGAGTTIAAIVECSGVEPVVVGKPEPYSTLLALREMGLPAKDVLMVGDRPDTDIAAGKAAGCQVALVLTGDVGEPETHDYPVYQDLLSLSLDL